MQYWLFKSEPSCFSIDDLKKNKTTFWDGVRNYQARNYMRDHMDIGDGVLFYHSNASPSAIVGLAKVISSFYPDDTAFDPKEKHYDPKSDLNNPRWFGVNISFVEKFHRILSLEELKKYNELKTMLLLKKGCRLSIQPIEKNHFMFIKSLLEKDCLHGK